MEASFALWFKFYYGTVIIDDLKPFLIFKILIKLQKITFRYLMTATCIFLDEYVQICVFFFLWPVLISDKTLSLYFTGVHPHDAKSWNHDTMSRLEELAKQPQCVAIGEAGLDFNRNFSPRDKQLEVFQKQVIFFLPVFSLALGTVQSFTWLLKVSLST